MDTDTTKETDRPVKEKRAGLPKTAEQPEQRDRQACQVGQKDQLAEKVRRYMEQEKMARRGSRILAGVSGGADSVCLLALLVRLSEECGWQIGAVHVNHRIREEAGEDAAYVRGLCAEWNVPFFLKEEDVKKKAGEWHMSLEEAGRKVRYQAFEEAAEQFGADRIAVAHNRNDRAETLLFHLFRGTGLKGMGSIRPARGKIIRPLLDTGREEIEEWLKKNGISWCTDASNETDDYTRNRIRRRVIPYVEEEICGEAGLHLAQAAGLLAQVSDYMDGQARARLEKCLVFRTEKTAGLDVQAFLASDGLLQTQMLKVLVEELSEGGKDIGQRHILDVQAAWRPDGSSDGSFWKERRKLPERHPPHRAGKHPPGVAEKRKPIFWRRCAKREARQWKSPAWGRWKSSSLTGKNLRELNKKRIRNGWIMIE